MVRLFLLTRLTSLGEALVALPQPFRGSLQELVPILGVIAIFFAGLAFDLLGQPFAWADMYVFRRSLEHHRGWVERVVARQEKSVADDLREFVDGFRSFVLWRPVAAARQAGLRRTYLRLQAYLVAFTAAFAGNQSAELLHEDLRLWRVTRAVAAALILFSAELVFLFVWYCCATPDRRAVLTGLASFGLFALGFILNRLSYHRFCITLFALALATLRQVDLATQAPRKTR